VNMENGHDSIRMRQVGGINEITIFQGKGGSVYGLAVSPKGDKLYFAQDNDLFVMPLPGGMARKIVSNAASPAAVSPDGTRVAFLRRVLNTWNVVLADADGSNEQVVRRRPMPLFYSDESLMSWSPDGRGLAVGARSSSSGELAIIDLARKTERVIPPQGWQGGIGNTAWLPDSSGIVLQAWTEGSFQLWLVKRVLSVELRDSN
jgi:Tol biopolymer transport system component